MNKKPSNTELIYNTSASNNAEFINIVMEQRDV
jgi:hypothetical protein